MQTEMTTDLTCSICEQPIDADAIAYPSVDGAPTHLACLERVATAPSPLPQVDAAIEALTAFGLIDLEDDGAAAKRAALAEVLAELFLAGHVAGERVRRQRIAAELVRGRWMELEARQRASVPEFIRNGRIGGAT